MGVAQSQQLKGYLTQALGIDSTYLNDFVKGLNEGVNAGDDKKKSAYFAGLQIGQQISQGMIPGMKKADNCELYAIAGRSIEKANKYKEDYGFEKAYGSYDELLDDPEVQAVYIPLPNDIHIKWVKEALKKKTNLVNTI